MGSWILWSGCTFALHQALTYKYAGVNDATLESFSRCTTSWVRGANVLAHVLDAVEEERVLALRLLWWLVRSLGSSWRGRDALRRRCRWHLRRWGTTWHARRGRVSVARGRGIADTRWRCAPNLVYHRTRGTRIADRWCTGRGATGLNDHIVVFIHDGWKNKDIRLGITQVSKLCTILNGCKIASYCINMNVSQCI